MNTHPAKSATTSLSAIARPAESSPKKVPRERSAVNQTKISTSKASANATSRVTLFHRYCTAESRTRLRTTRSSAQRTRPISTTPRTVIRIWS